MNMKKRLLIALIIVSTLLLLLFFGCKGYVSLLPTDERVSLSTPVEIKNNDALIELIIEKHQMNANRERSSSGKDHKWRHMFRYDINGDGKEDYIQEGSSSFWGTTYHIKVSGNFIAYKYLHADTLEGISSIGFDDIDGDGAIDAWITNSSDERVTVIWGGKRGGFVGRQGVPAFNSSHISFIDTDNDSELEMVYRKDKPLKDPQEFYTVEIIQNE